MSARRKPAGVPTGGQFAGTQHAEPNTEPTYVQAPAVNSADLTDQERLENSEGSFLFPPYPRTANQLAAFWENVEVEDDILGIFADGYWAEHKDNFKKWEAPKHMHSGQYRTLIRLYKMRIQSGWLPLSERAKMDNYSLVIPGTGRGCTLADTYSYYRCDLIFPSWNVLEYDPEFHGPSMRAKWTEDHKKFRHDQKNRQAPPL